MVCIISRNDKATWRDAASSRNPLIIEARLRKNWEGFRGTSCPPAFGVFTGRDLSD